MEDITVDLSENNTSRNVLKYLDPKANKKPRPNTARSSTNRSTQLQFNPKNDKIKSLLENNSKVQKFNKNNPTLVVKNNSKSNLIFKN